MQLLVAQRTASRSPLLSSLEPTARIAPVFLQMLIVDGELAVVEGPLTASGEPTAWVSSDTAVLELALGIWRGSFDLSRPVNAPGVPPPLNSRQVAVARALCRGAKDAGIARDLGVSVRTVERDVAVLFSHLGAGCRAEAVLIMLGRGVNSSDPPHTNTRSQ